MERTTPLTTSPTPLDAELRSAEALACALAEALDRAAADDVAIVWLAGRADEVLAVARGVVRDWAAGRLATGPAAQILREHTDGLRQSLSKWVEGEVGQCRGS
jgi:hypothetical protein